MTRIIGLFEDEQDLVCAIEGLYNHGFNHEDVEIINPNPLAQKRLVNRIIKQMAATAGPNLAGRVAANGNSPAKAAVKGRNVGIDPAGRLTTLGVPEAEACFFAVHVKRGQKLIIVQAGNERAREAQQIIRQANARVSTGYD